MTDVNSYNFGDCEIKHIAFADKGVTIGLYDPSHEKWLMVILEKVDLFTFETNLIQNVLDKVKTLSSAEVEEIAFIRSRLAAEDAAEIKTLFADGAHECLYFAPTAGPEGFAICLSHRVEVERQP
jgi:hypothetical protein